MLFRKLTLCLALFLVALLSPAAATDANQVGADRARFDQLRRRGLEATYNLDYDAAQRAFEELARTYPRDPAGPLFLATTVWLRTLNESRRLQSSLYNSDGFYIESEEKVNPQTLAQFKELVRSAKALAAARLKENPRDVEALYMQGAVDGLKAAFSASVERKFVGALRDGSSSVDRHRDVLKLDPNYIDAEFTLGLYDYVVGDLPLPIKMLASLGGFRGSRKRGLARIERVARESEWSGDNAKVILIAIMKREGRYAEASALARDLSAKYQRNYLFKIETADALTLQAAAQKKAGEAKEAEVAEREAFAIFDEMLRDPAVRRVAASLDLVHFRYGEALLAADLAEKAAAQFLLCTKAAKAQEQLVTLAHLRAAQALDIAGKRPEAVAQYRLATARPNVFDAHQSAERGLREPYKKQVN